MGCSPHLQFDSHYSWTHDSKSPGIATIMVGPCNYQLTGPVLIPSHPVVGNSQVTELAAATAACKCEGWGVLGVLWLWMWMVGKMGDTDRWKNIYNILLINDPSWQIRSWLHTNWTRHNDRTNVIATVCLIWYTHTMVTRCTTGYHW